MAKKQVTSAASKRKKKKQVSDPNGMAFVKATFNNVIVTITDSNGNVLSWSSAGKEGFKGSRKNTPYAAQLSAETAAKAAHEMGLATKLLLAICMYLIHIIKSGLKHMMPPKKVITIYLNNI